MFDLEVRRNEGEIEVDAVPLGDQIQLVQITYALRVNERVNGTPSNIERTSFHRSPIRVEACVSNNIRLFLPVRLHVLFICVK